PRTPSRPPRSGVPRDPCRPKCPKRGARLLTSRSPSCLHGDPESAKARRLLIVNVDPLDTGAARPDTAPGDERVDGLGRALDTSPDRPVRAVPHPAGEGAGFRPGSERVAKADALHEAGHDQTLARQRWTWTMLYAVVGVGGVEKRAFTA